METKIYSVSRLEDDKPYSNKTPSVELSLLEELSRDVEFTTKAGWGCYCNNDEVCCEVDVGCPSMNED